MGDREIEKPVDGVLQEPIKGPIKLLAVMVHHCRACPQFHRAAHYCNLNIAELGPIEMFEVARKGGIHPDCPLPDWKKSCEKCGGDGFIADEGEIKLTIPCPLCTKKADMDREYAKEEWNKP